MASAAPSDLSAVAPGGSEADQRDVDKKGGKKGTPKIFPYNIPLNLLDKSFCLGRLQVSGI